MYFICVYTNNMTNFTSPKTRGVTFLLSIFLLIPRRPPPSGDGSGLPPNHRQSCQNITNIYTIFLVSFFSFFSGFSNTYQSMCISRLRFMFLIFIFLFFLVLYFFSFFCVNLTLSLCYVKKEVVRKQRQLLEDVWALFLSWLFRRHSPSCDGFGLPALQTLKQDRHFL